MNPFVKTALAHYLRLSPSQREEFMTTLALNSEPADERYLEETKNKGGVICPHCGSRTCSIRVGKKDGRQRYKCKETGKYFSTTTGDVLYHTRKSLAVWKKYIGCFINGYTLKRCAEDCGINVKTAFAWRHKILDALRVMMSEVRLDGIVEADETYIRLSYAGNHKNSRSGFTMPRESHKRGGKATMRGVSHEQICIPCAVNRAKLSVSRVGCLGSASNKAVAAVLGGNIAEGSILCTDKSHAYKQLVAECGLEQVKIASGRTLRGQYGIQTVNNYHAKLKTFMRKFYGVSAKHLNNYLVYFNFLRGVAGGQTQKVKTLLDYIIEVKCYTRRDDISMRPNLPLAA